MRIIAVANQKGGVGKTTTTVNVAACLAEMGRRVLVVDCDAQANASSALGVDRASPRPTIYDVLVLGQPLAGARRSTGIAGLDIVPSAIALAGAEIELMALPRREMRLRYALDALDGSDDYVLLDCPPSLGLLTVNAVVAADSLLIPMQCEYFALEGLGALTHTIDLLRRELNSALAIDGIVLTLFDPRLTLATQVVAEVRRAFPADTLRTVIPRNVRLGEAPSHGLPITSYDPACRGAVAYRALAAELDTRVTRGAPGATAGAASRAAS